MFAGTRLKYLGIAALLFASLACRAATRLIIPDTPTPAPTATSTSTLTPTPSPTLTPTVMVEAACPDLLAKILRVSTIGGLSPMGGLGSRSDEDDEDVDLVTYVVDGSKLGEKHLDSAPSDLRDEQLDRATHEAIWNYFVSIIPPEQREDVSEFAIFTDGRGGHLAAVGQSYSEADQWTLYVDILDSKNHYDLTYTLLHEQGHLLTLNSEQVPPSQAVFDDPDNDAIYQREVSACPQYFPGEGCSTDESYINEFYSRYWPYIYEEWQEIDAEDDEDTYDDLLDDFYDKYEDQFLTDYAPTSPEEDIAEAWAFFILAPKPEPDSIANEKILFFYEYPELVQLRAQILNGVCTEFPK